MSSPRLPGPAGVPAPVSSTPDTDRASSAARQNPESGPAGTPRVIRWLGLLVRVMRSKAVRFGFLAVVLVLLGLALADQASTLWHEAQRLSAPFLLLAVALSIAGLFCNMMVWREIIADLGSPLPIAAAWRIFFIGNLSKYIPGSIWPVLVQAELGADRGIPRSRSAVSVLVSYTVMTCSGVVVAAITLPFAAAGSVAQYFWILILIPVGIAVLSPPVLNRLLGLVMRMARQPALGQGVSYRGLARTMAWAIAAWAANGLMIYVLMRQLSGERQGTLLVSVGAYALSWAVGFLAVFAPAGVGIREAVMTAALHSVTPLPIAFAVAVLQRAISVVADAATGGTAVGLIGRRQLRRLRSAGDDPSSGSGPAER